MSRCSFSTTVPDSNEDKQLCPICRNTFEGIIFPRLAVSI